MRFIALCFTLLVFFSLFFSLHTQDDTNLSDYFGGVLSLDEVSKDIPPYSYYRDCAKAQKFLDNAEYYEALKAYSALETRYGKTIDISIGLGETYYYLGDYKTSHRFFKQSMEFESFDAHSKWALVHYRVAMIAYHEKDEKKFVTFLRSIVKRDGSDDVSMRSVILSQGLDAALLYFTLSPSYAYEAYRELGLYLILTGKHEMGLMYAVTALAMAVRWGMRDIILNYDMAFTFSDLHYFLERLIQVREGRVFLQESEVGRILYALKRYFASQNAKTQEVRMPLPNGSYVQMLLTFLDNKSIFATMSDSEYKVYYPVIRL